MKKIHLRNLVATWRIARAPFLISLLISTGPLFAQSPSIFSVGSTASGTMPGSANDFALMSANTANFVGTPPDVYGGLTDQPSVLTDFSMSAISPSAENIWGGNAGTYSQIVTPTGVSVVTGALYGAIGGGANVNLINITLASNPNFNYSDFSVNVMYGSVPGDGTGVDGALTLSSGAASTTQVVNDPDGTGGSNTQALFAQFRVAGAQPGDVLTLGATDTLGRRTYISGISFNMNPHVVADGITTSNQMPGLVNDFAIISANTANFTGTLPNIYGGLSNQPSILRDFTMSAINPSAENIWGGNAGTYSQVTSPTGLNVVTGALFGAFGGSSNVNLANITLGSDPNFNYSNFYVEVMYGNVPGDGTGVDNSFTLTLGSVSDTQPVYDPNGTGGVTLPSFAEFHVTGATPRAVLSLGASSELGRRTYISGISLSSQSCLSPPTPTAENALSSDSFVDSIGVNVHLGFDDTAYWNYSGIVKPQLTNLGVRHIRDGYTSYMAAMSSEYNDLAGSGIKSDLLMIPSTALSLAATIPNSLEAVEGPNESDNQNNFSYNSQGFPVGTQEFQTDLYNAIKGNASTASLQVLAPTVINVDDLFSLGSVPCDDGNIHSYPGGGPPSNGLDSNCALESVVSGTTPIMATETGYYTYPDNSQGISQLAFSKYVPRVFLEYFRRGIARTYIYDLIDDWSATNPDLNNLTPQSHFGLVQVSGPGPNVTATPKVAYTALKNWIALLGDPGASFIPGSLNYSLSGTNQSVLRHLLLQKRDGSYWLAFWQDVSVFNTSTSTDLSPTSQTVTLTFGQPVGTVTTYLPNTSPNATSVFNAPTSLSLTVSDVPQLVEITGVARAATTAYSLGISMFGSSEGIMTSTTPYSTSTNFSTEEIQNSCGSDSSGTAYRTIIKFDLPPLPPGKSVNTASLLFDLLGIQGAPTTNLYLVAYQSSPANLRDSDWNDTTNLVSLGSILTPQSNAGIYTINNAALIQAIQSAYASGKTSIAFRFQLAGGEFTTGSSGSNTFYNIGSSDGLSQNERPALQITTH